MMAFCVFIRTHILYLSLTIHAGTEYRALVCAHTLTLTSSHASLSTDTIVPTITPSPATGAPYSNTLTMPSFPCVFTAAGMPLPNTGGLRFGDLYIKIDVAFPPAGSLSASALSTLRSTLPHTVIHDAAAEAVQAAVIAASAMATAPRPVGADGSPAAAGASAAPAAPWGGLKVEDVLLMDVSEESIRARAAAQKEAAGHGGGTAYSEEEDDEMGGNGGRPAGVQCAQQ